MKINYRQPDIKDGLDIYRLVQSCPPLDLNSAYCYLLLATHFADTCVIAEDTTAGKIAGFVSAYFRPDAPRTLFVWQIAVHPDYRGQGIARGLTTALVEAAYRQTTPPEYLELSVNPSNQASRGLFTRLAEQLGAELTESVLFSEELLGGGHEAEIMLRIGPLKGDPQ
ncbi:L-2,4-diaminobutyric acid acetyltransferase [Dehalogenimonas lykanthroporepellens BL-DC-9]|nr:L-2,4-diaminobutyric acid acetyltransferase [Dehalogenimonas lykanthroporepellens BL-DC-9]